MPVTWIRISRRFLPLLALCLVAQHALASSPTFHQSVTVGQDGKPSLQLTNDSALPITAFIMVEHPSLGLEGRLYCDVYVTPQRDHLILPGKPITIGLSHFEASDVSKVRAEVRAVIFKDGSTAGEPAWINAVLIRRVRLYDRLLALHDLFEGMVGAGLTRKAILDKLRAAKDITDNGLPNDDLRPIDEVAYYAAISTLRAAKEFNIDAAVRQYLRYLAKRMIQLEISHPALDQVRAVPNRDPGPASR